jgi:hypothetical protein
MSVIKPANCNSEDNKLLPSKQNLADLLSSTIQKPSTVVSAGGEDAASSLTLAPESKIANGLDDTTKPTIRKSKTPHSARASTVIPGVCGTLTNLIVAQDKYPRAIIDEVLRCLSDVEVQMSAFRTYIKTQNDEDIPLYQWATYSGYASLDDAVLQLERLTVKLKTIRMPQDYLPASLSRAMEYSTSISNAATYGFTIMNNKTSKHMEEMEGSMLSEEARSLANAVITEELQKLMDHSFRAVKNVWLTIDLLRDCEQKRSHYKGWGWSSLAATIMTTVVAATVGLVTARLYGLAGFYLVPSSSPGGGMYTQLIDLVQRTQAVTNLTSELYTIKLRDIDYRYDYLAALSESHGLRIDNLVEALGPPNEEGTYYPPKPKTDIGSCKDLERIMRKTSEESKRQSQRYQSEIELMRKNINRMDIRLTSSIEKKCKG